MYVDGLGRARAGRTPCVPGSDEPPRAGIPASRRRTPGLLTRSPCASGSRSGSRDCGSAGSSSRELPAQHAAHRGPAVFPMCRKMIVGTPSSRAAGARRSSAPGYRWPRRRSVPGRSHRSRPSSDGARWRDRPHRVLLVAGTGQDRRDDHVPSARPGAWIRRGGRARPPLGQGPDREPRPGCGEPFLECPFWSVVGEVAFGPVAGRCADLTGSAAPCC